MRFMSRRFPAFRRMRREQERNVADRTEAFNFHGGCSIVIVREHIEQRQETQGEEQV